MTNTNCLAGMACPSCGSLGPFDIEATTTVTVFDDGTDSASGFEWSTESACLCVECGHEDKASGFEVKPGGAS